MDEDERPFIRLLVAVLTRTALDVAAVAKIDKKAKMEANIWIRHPGDEPWSFIWVCEHLNLDPGLIQKNILAFEAESEYLKSEKFSIHTSSGLESFIANLLIPEDKWILFH